MRTMPVLRLVKSINTEKDLFFIRFILNVYLNQHCVFVWLISIIVKFCILAANDFDKTGFSSIIYPVNPKCINDYLIFCITYIFTQFDSIIH